MSRPHLPFWTLLGLGVGIVAVLTLSIFSIRVSSREELSIVLHDRDVRYLMEHPTEKWRTLLLDFEWRVALEAPKGYLTQYGQLAFDAPCRVRLLTGDSTREVDAVRITTAERELFVNHDVSSLLDQRNAPCPNPAEPESLPGDPSVFDKVGGLIDRGSIENLEIDYRAETRVVEVAGRQAVEAVGTVHCVIVGHCWDRRIVMAVDSRTGLILRWAEYLPSDMSGPLTTFQVLHVAYDLDLPDGLFETEESKLDLGQYHFDELDETLR